MTVHFAPIPLEDRVSFEAFEGRTRGGYATSRGVSVMPLTAAILLTAGLVSSLFLMNIHGRKHEATRLAMVELRDTPPAAPKQPEKAAEPVEAPLMSAPVPAPQQIAQIPAPAIPLAAAPAPRAAVDAPPAPVTAPPAAPKAAPSTQSSDLSGNLLSAKPPSYPVECRRNREQGTVVLAVVLAPSGEVQEISIAKSSGFDKLDKAALAAVKKWLWTPFKRDGAAVAVRGEVKIPFVLRS
ncbi:MAG: TonB family protein [Candidatus Andeanibacterium colombiense]|uniref:TonB family protein n=1 Tax=Candidatus Andeanibacterium colombiense TaxID=3121345 RepID=A0AAJ5X6M5_9SPHN|nr:MAG: TonB family protein [Sphingomonadaceae bacterium]